MALPSANEDHDRFITLFLQSERDVLRYVLSIVPNLAEAREIVQTTAIELWRKFSEYDVTRPFTPWACRFALRQTQTYLRKTQRWRVMLDDSLLETLAEERAQLSEAMEQRFAHLEHCIGLLPETQREVVQLYYHEETELPEMSRQLGRSVEGLYKALQRIRAALMECMTRTQAGEASA